MDGWTRLIYFVCCDPGASDKVLAILPDSYSSSGLISSKFRSAFGIGRLANGRESRHRYQAPFLASVSHDAVLVLDPNPSENFGHPVALFYVDFNVTKKRCSHLDGIYLGESGWMGFRCIWFVIDTTMAFSKAQTSTEARTFTDTQRLNILAKMKISAHTPPQMWFSCSLSFRTVGEENKSRNAKEDLCNDKKKNLLLRIYLLLHTTC